MDEFYNTSMKEISGIDLEKEFEYKRKKIGSLEWKNRMKDLDF